MKLLVRAGRRPVLPARAQALALALVFIIGLGGCQEGAATPPPASPPATTATTVAAPSATFSPLTETTVVAAIATVPAASVAPVLSPAITSAPATAPTAAATTPASGSPSGQVAGREAALKAARTLAGSGSFRYTVRQSGELTGAGLTQFEAVGQGEWQRPLFHQLLTLNLDGQATRIEHFGRDRQLFQRVVELAVWRRQAPAFNLPAPDPVWLEQAANLRAGAPETIAGLTAQRWDWDAPAYLLLPDQGRIETAGALSATNLYLPFISDKAALARSSLWAAPDGRPLRYAVNLEMSAGANRLTYRVVYDYSEIGSPSITVATPGDLP